MIFLSSGSEAAYRSMASPTAESARTETVKPFPHPSGKRRSEPFASIMCGKIASCDEWKANGDIAPRGLPERHR